MCIDKGLFGEEEPYEEIKGLMQRCEVWYRYVDSYVHESWIVTQSMI